MLPSLPRRNNTHVRQISAYLQEDLLIDVSPHSIANDLGDMVEDGGSNTYSVRLIKYYTCLGMLG
jgi:hypothetical protein